MASSSSSTAGRYSVPLRVVCEPKLFSSDIPRALKEPILSLGDSDGKTARKDCYDTDEGREDLHEGRVERILRLGWDTMSSTSSGLLCKMAAASLKVTPSKLVLFREMRRPPGKIRSLLQSVVGFYLINGASAHRV